MMNDVIADAGDLKKYRTELPNLIDDMGLSVYAFRLYVHVKRVCGAHSGVCYQSTETIAKHCGMSMGAVSKAKQELAHHKLITIVKHPNGARLSDELRVVDVWEKNFAAYSEPSPYEDKKEPYITRRITRKEISERVAQAGRVKRARAARHAAWAMLSIEQQRAELQKYRNYAKKYPTQHWWEADLWYLELLTGD